MASDTKTESPNTTKITPAEAEKLLSTKIGRLERSINRVSECYSAPGLLNFFDNQIQHLKQCLLAIQFLKENLQNITDSEYQEGVAFIEKEFQNVQQQIEFFEDGQISALSEEDTKTCMDQLIAHINTPSYAALHPSDTKPNNIARYINTTSRDARRKYQHYFVDPITRLETLKKYAAQNGWTSLANQARGTLAEYYFSQKKNYDARKLSREITDPYDLPHNQAGLIGTHCADPQRNANADDEKAGLQLRLRAIDGVFQKESTPMSRFYETYIQSHQAKGEDAQADDYRAMLAQEYFFNGNIEKGLAVIRSISNLEHLSDEQTYAIGKNCIALEGSTPESVAVGQSLLQRVLQSEKTTPLIAPRTIGEAAKVLLDEVAQQQSKDAECAVNEKRSLFEPVLSCSIGQTFLAPPAIVEKEGARVTAPVETLQL